MKLIKRDLDLDLVLLKITQVSPAKDHEPRPLHSTMIRNISVNLKYYSTCTSILCFLRQRVRNRSKYYQYALTAY